MVLYDYGQNAKSVCEAKYSSSSFVECRPAVKQKQLRRIKEGLGSPTGRPAAVCWMERLQISLLWSFSFGTPQMKIQVEKSGVKQSISREA